MPFTPKTLVQCIPNMTPDDVGNVIEIQHIRAGDRVLTGKGNWQVVGEVRTNTYSGPVFSIGDGRVTPSSELESDAAWVKASELGLRSENFSGNVYNLLIAHEATDAGDNPFTDRSFTLPNGRVAKGL